MCKKGEEITMAKTAVEPIKAGLDLGNGYVKANLIGRVRVSPLNSLIQIRLRLLLME
jgi:hypothetical protein